jgi:hypothetical protein
MALFKISKGLKANLPTIKTSGYCWYTIDDSMFYIDHEDENGNVQRKALNAQEAQMLSGASLSTILNSSDIEIPTSKAVWDAISEAAVANQSDWSVDDETNPAYVKNRTHWSKVSLVEILPEHQLEAVDGRLALTTKINVAIGHTYIVNWNGTPYTCVAGSFNGLAFIGNGVRLGMEDTGEPFTIGVYPDEWASAMGCYAEIMPLDESTTCTLSIIERIEEIQKIDNKYLSDEVVAKPDWNASEGESGHILNRTHYTEEALEEIIPETTVTFGDPTKPGYDTGAATGSAIQIYPERDETYVIEWNGVTYYSEVREYTKSDGSFGRGIGNTGMFGGVSYRQYPFLIGFLTEKEAVTAGYTYFVSVEDESTTATFSVSRVGEAVHRLDAKYLPEETATKEYVDTAISASRNQWTKVQDITVEEEVGYLFFSTDSSGVELKDKNYTKAYLFIETTPQATTSNGELQAFINVWYESQTSRPRASAGNTFIKSTSKQYWKAQFDIDNALCLFGLKGIADEGWSDTINSTPDSYKLFANGAGGIYTKYGFVNNIKIQAPIGIPVGTKIQIWMR